jgi:hypothetical protein
VKNRTANPSMPAQIQVQIVYLVSFIKQCRLAEIYDIAKVGFAMT